MQPIQKFSDFQSKKNETAQAVKEADLQKEYGEVFTSLLKKYGVSSPAELDDDKKKEFFNEIGDHYTAGEGPTAKGEELVKKEDGEEPVKEDEDEDEGEGDGGNGHGEGEEDKDEEEIINNVASLESEEEVPAEDKEDKEEKPKEEVEEDAAEDIEKEKVAQGEPEPAEGDVEKQPEEVEAAAEVEDDPEAGKAAEMAPDEDTAKEIEKEKVEAGKPEKVVMDFDSFVKKMS
jgi:hypothetical protein